MHAFVTREGKSMTPANFCHWWRNSMESSGIPYCRATLARSSFVSQYTSTVGVSPDMWSGAATCMNNTVAQWDAEYNYNKRPREAQAAIDGHAAFVDAATKYM